MNKAWAEMDSAQYFAKKYKNVSDVRISKLDEKSQGCMKKVWAKLDFFKYIAGRYENVSDVRISKLD